MYEAGTSEGLAWIAMQHVPGQTLAAHLAARRQVEGDAGEKAADAACKLFPDWVVVTSPGGCKAASKADWSPLQGRHVVVWPDNEEQGVAYVCRSRCPALWGLWGDL